MMRRTLSILLVFTASLTCFAQEELRQKFEAFTRSATRSYEYFTDSANVVFTHTLQKDWELFNLNEGKSRTVPPRPEIKCPLKPVIDTGICLPVSDTVGPMIQKWHSVPASSKVPSKNEEPTREIRMSFYETSQILKVPSGYGSFHPGGIDEKSVASFWKELAVHDFSVIVSKAEEMQGIYGLNDWAVLQWVQALAESLYPSDICSERIVFTVFILNQIGLMAKIGRSAGGLLCLFPAVQQIYARKYVIIDDCPYYLIGRYSGASDIYTYRTNFQFADNPFDLRVSKPFMFGEEMPSRQISKPSSVFNSEIRVFVNKAAAAYFSSYPQLDPVYYATARCSNVFESSLNRQISELFSNDNSVCFKLEKILHFVQFDFKYGNDMEVLGRETPLFPEQDFLYEYNDCEDRTALLNFLVKNVLNLSTLVLEYPDHVALAVEIPSDIKGDYVKYGGKKYYMCDPSYIGSGIGMTMPEYRSVPAKIWVTE